MMSVPQTAGLVGPVRSLELGRAEIADLGAWSTMTSDIANDSPEPPDVPAILARLQALGDVLMWIGASQLQIQRFLAAWVRPTSVRPNPEAWRSSLYVVEAHLLAVTANHVVTALDALPTDVAAPSLSPEVRRSVELLRDIWEHWDEQRETFATEPVRSGKLFRQEFPDESPWSFSYSNAPGRGTRVGAVLQIETLADEMEQVATALQPLVDQALHEIGMLPYNGPAVDFNSSVGPATTPEALAVAAFGGARQGGPLISTGRPRGCARSRGHRAEFQRAARGLVGAGPSRPRRLGGRGQQQRRRGLVGPRRRRVRRRGRACRQDVGPSLLPRNRD